ncbi:MAG: P-loop NTPase fold protein, partial [Gemmatimonadales bacterium]
MAPPDPAAARPDRRSDWPLDDPEQDLLGVSRHAEALARLIVAAPAPFTIGVYGEWGAGKTTFVQFVKHYLDRAAGAGSPPIFIHFEAWRYTTADELWRALVLDIARAVYEIDPDASPCAPPSLTPAASRSLLDVLASDAVVFRSATAEETKADRFCRLVARLDATMYGGIGKRAQDERRLDQDETVLAAVNASLAALGAMSPLVGAVRRLFGLGDSVDVAKLFQREKSESTRERIESKREFQVVLAELLRAPPAPPAPPRVCVFLDDLDRC